MERRRSRKLSCRTHSCSKVSWMVTTCGMPAMGTALLAGLQSRFGRCPAHGPGQGPPVPDPQPAAPGVRYPDDLDAGRCPKPLGRDRFRGEQGERVLGLGPGRQQLAQVGADAPEFGQAEHLGVNGDAHGSVLREKSFQHRGGLIGPVPPRCGFSSSRLAAGSPARARPGRFPRRMRNLSRPWPSRPARPDPGAWTRAWDTTGGGGRWPGNHRV